MKKVMWFSGRDMDEDQKNDLVRIYGKVEVNQINKTINSAQELSAEIEEADIIAIMAPLNLQQEFLKLAGNKPVIFSRFLRIINAETDEIEDVFAGWFRLEKIEVIFTKL